MIKVENLKKIYETKVRKGMFRTEKVYLEAVKNISMDIDKGKIVGLLGINGAGKTTTIKMLSTLLLPTSGSIIVDGIDTVKKPMIVKNKINMVAGGERMIYWRLSGRENLWYYGQIYGVENNILSKRIDELLDLVGITDKQDTPVENYSKGMKQRLQIARGLINNPDYIFMDEPTLGLDAVIAKELRQHVRKIAYEEGKGILLTSHYMAEIEELCDYIYIVNKGEVIESGTPKQLALRGLKSRILRLKVENVKDYFYERLCNECRLYDDSSIITYDEAEDMYIIEAHNNLAAALSKFCMSNKAIIIKLYEEEPKLEDAIIRFAKEA